MPLAEPTPRARPWHASFPPTSPGEVFALLGANGAGKTVTMKMLTTLLRPSAGNARVASFDIVHHAAQVRRVIGYVPQLVSADGALTGYENLLIFAKLYDIPRADRQERIQEALAFMGLTDVSDKLVREYSGGRIRRLEIAESMLHRPPVFFLDEPTVGLDPVARDAVWERVEDLRQRYGTTIVFTTHLMDEADHLGTGLAIMHRGRVVVSGTPADLKAAVGGSDTTLDVCSFTMREERWRQEKHIVRPLRSEGPPGGWAEAAGAVPVGPLASAAGFVEKTLVIAELEARKLRHDPTELLTRAIQPALWFVVLGCSPSPTDGRTAGSGGHSGLSGRCRASGSAVWRRSARRTQRHWWPQYVQFGRLQDRRVHRIDDVPSIRLAERAARVLRLGARGNEGRR